MIRVLIIDDDKLARKGIISIVPWESLGMEIAGEASNGQKALELLEHESIDLCVVDIVMPIMTGLEFIKESQRIYKDMLYIVLSFNEEFEYVQAAWRLGIIDYISKMRLEQQNCIDIFKRSANFINQKKSQVVPCDVRTQSGSKNWNSIEKNWLRYYWLFTDEAMEEISSMTYTGNPTLKQLEYLLVRLADIAKVEYEYQDLLEIPTIDRMESAINWIETLKKNIIKFALEKKENPSAKICMLRAIEYVKRNLQENITIEKAAEVVGFSRSYFASNFKKIVGVTFNQFLRTKRIKEAERLLSGNQATQSTIAQMVGYEDEKYFASIFSDMVGITPVEYIKRVKAK